jgi:hypothetical protein
MEGTDRATSYDQQFINHDYDIAMHGGAPGTGPDPCIGIFRFYNSENIGDAYWNNVAAYVNPEVDSLFNQAMGVSNFTERKALFDAVQQIIMTDLPYIWVIWPEDIVVIRNDVMNLEWTEGTQISLGSTYLSTASVHSTSEASLAIASAEQQIAAAKAKNWTVAAAESKLQEAKTDLNQVGTLDHYDNAYALANAAIQLIQEPETQPAPAEPPYLLYAAIAIIAIIIVASGIYLYKRKTDQPKT